MNNIEWAIILLVVGTVLLLRNLGWLPPETTTGALVNLWPLLLVWLGLRLILQRFWRRGPQRLEIPLDGVQSAEVTLRFGAGRLTVIDADEPGRLLAGEFGGGVHHRYAVSGGVGRLALSRPSEFISFNNQGVEWEVGLARGVPLRLTVRTGASENDLDLRELDVKELTVKCGAAQTQIEFPKAAGQTRAGLKAGASSVRLLIPEGVAGRIRARVSVGAFRVDGARFPRTGRDTWQSPDYDSAHNRLELEVEGGMGEVSVQ